jgi:hypothetical protein
MDTFVITGDIEAMWLRDSTNQLLPYVPLAHKDPGLKAMLCGAIRRQARQVRTNRYANAFNLGEEAAGHKADAVVTKPPLTWRQEGEVYESKYELNSLANVLKLSTLYHTATGKKTTTKKQKKRAISTASGGATTGWRRRRPSWTRSRCSRPARTRTLPTPRTRSTARRPWRDRHADEQRPRGAGEAVRALQVVLPGVGRRGDAAV